MFSCRGSVGRWHRKASILSLGRWCDNLLVVLHELGHTIGYFHEQNRPDRNKYVRILWENIDPKNRDFFGRRRALADSRGIPYDYNSIMHYGAKTFSRNNKPTIISLDPSIKSLGNTGLSQLDIRQTNLLYSCLDYPEFPDDFFFTTGMPPHTAYCVSMKEPKDRSWTTTNICYRKDKKKMSILWSHTGNILSMECTNTIMPRKRIDAKYWQDNYLCVPRDSSLKFHWSVSGPINGMKCSVIIPGSNHRDRYYLCAKKQTIVKDATKSVGENYSHWSAWQPCSKDCGGGTQSKYRTCKRKGTCVGKTWETRMCNVQKCLSWPHFPEDFKFYIGNYKPGLSCAQIYERKDYWSWINHKFCWSIVNRRNLKIRWSDSGKIPGMKCTKITEPTERHTTGWNDNYLCIQSNAPYRFRWSSYGPMRGLKCVPWRAKRGSRGWYNNYLCGDKFPVKHSCPVDWAAYTTRDFDLCYRQFRKRLSWKESAVDCRKQNAQLLSITTSKEAKFVASKVQSTHAWIGFSYTKKQRQWEWIDGNNVTYTNWRKLKPVIKQPGKECTLVDVYTSHWRKWPCHERFPFICKMRLSRKISKVNKKG